MTPALGTFWSGRRFLEEYAGTGALTAAVARVGIACEEPVEIKNGRDAMKLQGFYLECAAELGFVHFGIECKTWCLQRRS